MRILSGEDVIRPKVFSAWPQVIACMSTRRGGPDHSPFGMNLSYNVGDATDRVDANRLHFFGACGIEQRELAVPRQIHSATVRIVDTPGVYPDCDALVSNVPRVFLCVTVADCVPILLVDPVTSVAAAVHAGWRGTAAGIVRTAVTVMKDRFASQPSHLLAFLGPAAGDCCYSVGADVAARFDDRHVVQRGELMCVDLKGANRSQLLEMGISPEQIEVHPSCTITQKDTFHSYRREKEHSGRMMAVVGFSR
jgi:hypothetical protein